METRLGSDKRIHSIDITRGFIVALSAFLSHIPPGGYDLFRHADWYGLTILDFIFPSFLTVFGISIAVAYDRKIKWRKVIRRTVVLVLFGILFNMIVSWNVDLANVRYTGVLQFYAIIGLLTVLVMTVTRKWWAALTISFTILGGYLLVLLGMSAACAGGVPQPHCNPSAVVDSFVFGENMYAEGTRGFDPEGLITLIGATANAILGFAAGRLLLMRRENGAFWALIAVGCALLLSSLLVAEFIPYGKRMWTPSFALLTAGVTIVALAVFHAIIDQGKVAGRFVWLLQAFGRNSFLVYFGKYVLASIMVNVMIVDRSLREWLRGWMEGWSVAPQLTYALLLFSFWALVAAIMHWRKWYIRV